MSFETRFIRKDGSFTWLKLTVSLQRNGEGPAFHLLIFAEDINGRKACEAGVATVPSPPPAKEARYRNVFQTCPDAVLIARLSDGKIIDANQAFLDVMGFESGEVIGRTSLELGMWADASDRQKLAEALEGKAGCRDVEVRLKKKNGEVIWAKLSAFFTEIEGAPSILSFIRMFPRPDSPKRRSRISLSTTP